MQTSQTKGKSAQSFEKDDTYFPPIDNDALLESIFEAAKKVNPYALFDLTVDPYPPKSVQEVVEAICLLLGLQPDWNNVKKMILEERLAPMIVEFHPESVPDIYLEQISQMSTLPEMQIELLEKQSTGIGQLGEWIHAIAIYYDVKHKPMLYEFLTERALPEPEIVIPEPEKPKEPEKKEEPKKEEPKKEKPAPPPPRIISIKEALESIKNLNKQDIVEVRSYKTPPAVVLLVLEALCIVFDAMKVERKGNKIIYEPNYKKLLQDTDAFIRKVLSLDYDKISKEKINRLRAYIVKPEFEVEKVKKASTAAASFTLLIISIVQKYDQQKAA